MLLSACAAPPRGPVSPTASSPDKSPVATYVAPVYGGTVRLAMRGFVARGEQFGVFVLRDNERCEGMERVGLSVPDSAALPTTTLMSWQPVTVEFGVRQVGGGVCISRWTFTPANGRSYALIGSSDGGADCRATRAAIYDTSDGDIKLEPSARKRHSLTEACVPLAQSPTIASLMKEPMPSAGPQARASTREAVLHIDASSEDLKGLRP